MLDLTGQTLGQYRIIEPLGRGGMASVYKAFQPSLERYVAIKVLPPYYAHEPGFAERFAREARAIAQLEHPHILPVYDSGQEGEHTYIVIKYVPAGTLKSRITSGPMPLDETADVISQIAQALDHAHKRGVIHRDVKPSNILMDQENHALLTDFGLAKMVEGSKQLTASGVGVGTPAYMAPEQGQGTDVDGRADVYSLGVVLYEMLTGQVPFDAETPMAVVIKHITDPLPMPRTVNPAIPEPVEMVVLKALAKDPDDRYATAGEMASALRRALATQEAYPILFSTPEAKEPEVAPVVSSEPETAPAAPAPTARQSVPWSVAAMGIVSLLAIVGVILVATGVIRPPAPETPTPVPVVAVTPETQEATPTVIEPTSTKTVPAQTTSTPTAVPTKKPARTPTLQPTLELDAFVDSEQRLGYEQSRSLAFGDLDSDGDLDLVVGNNGPCKIWLNDGTGEFVDSGQNLGEEANNAVALGDLDGDGDLDVLFGNERENWVWLNDGTGHFQDSGHRLGGFQTFGVALGDLDGDGDLDAFVGNSRDNNVWTNDGTGTLTMHQSLPGSNAQAVALGDLDGDGDLDAFVASDMGQANTVWLNDGSASFAHNGQRLGGADSFGVDLGDVDEDGDLDAFVANSNEQPDEVWLNDGTGFFSDSGQMLGSYVSEAVVLEDLDGDGDLDALVGDWGGMPNRIWLNSGSAQGGTLGVFVDSGQELGGSGTVAVALGDIDGDGDLDAAIGNYDGANEIWINQGRGMDTVQVSLPSSLTQQARAFAKPILASIAGRAPDWSDDFDDAGSGWVVSSGVQDASGYLGGLLTLSALPSQGASAESLVLPYLNDVVIEVDVRMVSGKEGDWSISLRRVDDAAETDPGTCAAALDAAAQVSINCCSSDECDGKGGLQTPALQGPGEMNHLRMIALGPQIAVEVNGEWVAVIEDRYFSAQTAQRWLRFEMMNLAESGDTLLQVQWEKLRIWNISAPPPTDQPASGEGALLVDSGQELGDGNTMSAALGDLDSDGDVDVFAANHEANEVWLNNGTGILVDSGQRLGGQQSYGVALGDVDGDGDLDAFVGNDGPNLVWLNDGTGTLSNSEQYLGGGNGYAIALQDLDGDGDLDAFEASGSANLVWLNDGTGTFVDSEQRLGSSDSVGLAMGDLDGDGDLDALMANWVGDGTNWIWVNNGTGRFTRGQGLGDSESRAVALGDLDGDGDLDAFVANHNQPNRVWLNDGTGTFVDSGQALGAMDSGGVALGDLDGDGDLDAFVGNVGPNKVWLNDGNGTFADSGLNLDYSSTWPVALADLDGDGDLDAFAGNDRPSKVWLNQTRRD